MKKSPGDIFADAFFGALQRGAAEGGAEIMRHLEREIGGGLKRAGLKLDALARPAAPVCDCEPAHVEVKTRAGVVEIETVHASDCSARSR